jgi:phasin family protein
MVSVPTSPFFGADITESLFSGFNERAKSGFEKSAKLGEKLTNVTKGNVEALVASGRTVAKGAETLTQEAAAYSKKSFETAVDAVKGFTAAKTPMELFQLQGAYAKSSFESAAAEAAKLSELWVKLASDIFQPLSSRYTEAADKIKAAAI